MPLEENEVFFLSSKNRLYYRGETKVPHDWSDSYWPLITILAVPLYAAVVTFLLSRQRISFEVSIALLVVFFPFCVAYRAFSYRHAVRVFSNRQFFFTRDFGMTWFSPNEGIECEAVFVFHEPHLFRGRKYGGSQQDQFREGMSLCAIYLGRNNFYVL